jgi:hypothetical protein
MIHLLFSEEMGRERMVHGTISPEPFPWNHFSPATCVMIKTGKVENRNSFLIPLFKRRKAARYGYSYQLGGF